LGVVRQTACEMLMFVDLAVVVSVINFPFLKPGLTG
jgi:hypothetical protein